MYMARTVIVLELELARALMGVWLGDAIMELEEFNMYPFDRICLIFWCNIYSERVKI